MKWQPIETAPKDGTIVLVYAKETQEYAIVFWNRYYREWNQRSMEEEELESPTHWMPLPEAPEEEK